MENPRIWGDGVSYQLEEDNKEADEILVIRKTSVQVNLSNCADGKAKQTGQKPRAPVGQVSAT